MNTHDLESITVEGKATLPRNDRSSVIALTFISSSLSSRLIRCERVDDVEYSLDRFPIRTVLDIEMPIRLQEKRMNWNTSMLNSFRKSKKGYKQETILRKPDANRVLMLDATRGRSISNHLLNPIGKSIGMVKPRF
jgi:hypothetical protein